MARDLPQPLKIVSGVFIIIGTLALIQTLYSLLREALLNIDFRLVFLIVGYGLLRTNPLWRSFAIYCSLIIITLLCANLLLVLCGYKSLQGVPTTTQAFFWIQTLLGIAACGYALWVLHRGDVRRAFSSN